MTTAEILAELNDIEKRIGTLMAGLRPDGRCGGPMESGVWWSLSSAQGSVDAAIGKALRYREQQSEAQP